MSAPAPALTAKPDRVVKVRIADAAGAAGCVSLIFSLLLVVFPDYFPRLIIENWYAGRLTVGLLLLTVLFNCALYFGIARQRSALTAPLAWGAILTGTVVTVLTFSAIVPGVVLVSHWNSRALVHEDVIFLVYFALIAAIFFPFLLIRFTQDLKKKQS